jgi:hypothetical protein
MTDPTGPDLVMACIRRDHRWDWQVDDREIYLARLVRDLPLPVEAITARLYAAPPQHADDDNEFDLTLGVLNVLARAGVREVVEEIRQYVRAGDRWVEAMETIAGSWPQTWWDDLYPTVADRFAPTVPDTLLWRSPPWTSWAQRDARIAAAIEADAERLAARPPRPFRDTPTPTLLALLADPNRAGDWRLALRELRRRAPEPALLDLVDTLLTANVGGAFLGAVVKIGAPAVPAARRWPPHPTTRCGGTRIACSPRTGDATDVPALLAGLDWLDERPSDLCGYSELVAGLARIGGAATALVVPRLRSLWFSPHSYERAAYLSALMTLDPSGARRRLVEGLWDCEADVRLLSATHAPLDKHTTERLRYLRDDPIETAEVRTAAAARLA